MRVTVTVAIRGSLDVPCATSGIHMRELRVRILRWTVPRCPPLRHCVQRRIRAERDVHRMEHVDNVRRVGHPIQDVWRHAVAHAVHA